MSSSTRITLTQDEIKALRVAARLFSYSDRDPEPETGMSYKEVRPILQALVARLPTAQPLKS